MGGSVASGVMRHRCPDPSCPHERNHPRWDVLVREWWPDESLRRGVAPTDVDHFIEIDGWFLIFEWKSPRPGADWPRGWREYGQHRALWSVVRASDRATLVEIWGDPLQPYVERAILTLPDWFFERVSEAHRARMFGNEVRIGSGGAQAELARWLRGWLKQARGK